MEAAQRSSDRIQPCKLCGLLVGNRRRRIPCAFCDIDVLCENCAVTDDPSTAGLPWCGECDAKDQMTKGAHVENRAVGAGYFVAAVPGGDVPVAPGNKRCYVCNAEYGMLRWKVRCMDCKRLLCDSCARKIRDGLGGKGKGKLELCPSCVACRLEGTVQPPYYEEEGRKIARERSSSQKAPSPSSPPRGATSKQQASSSTAQLEQGSTPQQVQPSSSQEAALEPLSRSLPGPPTGTNSSALFEDYLFSSGGAPPGASTDSQPAFRPPWEPPSPSGPQPEYAPTAAAFATVSPEPPPQWHHQKRPPPIRHVDAVPASAPAATATGGGIPRPAGMQRYRADSTIASTPPQPYDSVSPSWSDRMSRRGSSLTSQMLRDPSVSPSPHHQQQPGVPQAAAGGSYMSPSPQAQHPSRSRPPPPTSAPQFDATSLEALPGESDEDFARRLAALLN